MDALTVWGQLSTGIQALLVENLCLKKFTYAVDSTFTHNTDNMEAIHKTVTFILKCCLKHKCSGS